MNPNIKTLEKIRKALAGETWDTGLPTEAGPTKYTSEYRAKILLEAIMELINAQKAKHKNTKG